jgi:hypothetical protein
MQHPQLRAEAPAAEYKEVVLEFQQQYVSQADMEALAAARDEYVQHTT